MVLYLASDESQWVTGTAMIVDGGLTVGPNLSGLSAQFQESTQGIYVGPRSGDGMARRTADSGGRHHAHDDDSCTIAREALRSRCFLDTRTSSQQKRDT
jgi:hypothetical protein